MKIQLSILIGVLSLAGAAATREERIANFAQEGECALADRLQMYWRSHATDVYVRDEAVVGAGGKRAPSPTVMFDGARSHATDYERPAIEELPYKSEDGRGLFLRPKSGGEREWVPYGKTGNMICSINTEIVKLARDAAKEYLKRKEGGAPEEEYEPYARLAFNVLEKYLLGIQGRNVPTDLGRGHMQTLFGMQSFETIHDNTLEPCCELYSLMKEYVGENIPKRLPQYQAALKKWAEVQIANGVADNNWDIMQLNAILNVACVLEPDASYKDGKGREHYIDVVLNQSSVRNLSVKDLCAKGFDQDTGIWWECPGYSLVTLKDLVKFADKMKAMAGIDLHKEIPVLDKALAAANEYLFPDGYLIGFGDTHPGAPLPADFPKTAPSPFFYAPNASWLVARSGMDRTNDVAFALNASLGNHQHANGISLELYARGYRLAPDAGIGWTLYSGDDYKEYYSQFPAHNTVMVNSRSSYQTMKSFHPFKLLAHGENWATVSFREPATGAEQMRTTAYVKRDGVAYFVDAFRSRVEDCPSQWHDYYYHNFGDKMELDGKLAPTEEIAFVESGLYALSYIKDKFARAGDTDAKAVFDWARPEGNIRTTLYMNGAKGRTFIKAFAPATEGLSRMKDPDYGITKDSRTPVFVARHKGDAWETPFFAVIDVSGAIDKVEFGKNTVTVFAKDGKADKFTLADAEPYYIKE